MLISAVFIFLIAFGGLALTYLVAEDEPFLWRLSAGCVIGSAVFGLAAFLAASLFGFNTVTVFASLAVTMLPLLLLRSRDFRGRFRHDWARAKGKLQGANAKKAARFVYYLFFFVLLWFFFRQAMFEMKDGIYTGGSQNLGDLPFHLGAIFSFTDGNNFPPQNPSFAGARFSYPFIADFITACLVKIGADVQNAMFVLNLSWALSLLVVLEKFAERLTDNKLVGRLAPALLFFSGGIGFLWFFKDFWESGRELFDFLRHLPRDYTISDQFRWGNSLVVLFITQRSLLLGMPLTVIVLGYLWKIFSGENGEERKEDAETRRHGDAGKKLRSEYSVAESLRHRVTASLLVGLLAGTLPLIHLHSLFVLFVVTAFLFAFKPNEWRTWIAFGAGVGVIAIPELAWSMAGSASETSKFFGWHFGWHKGDDNIIWFWIKNWGVVIPILIAGIYLLFLSQRHRDAEKVTDAEMELNDAETLRHRGAAKKHRSDYRVTASLRHRAFPSPGHPVALLLFYIPFAVLFIVSNVAKLAPWEWDNIKILIYWYVGSIPFIAMAIVWGWNGNKWMKAAAGICFAGLVFSGALDVWRTASAQIKSKVFDRDAMQIAEQIKQKTAPGALFLNAPTYNSAVVLSGRRSLMRYSGHLSSHGIDYAERESDVKHIYEGGGVADIFLRKYDVEYVLISPEERTSLKANEDFFGKYPVVAESGRYRVYKIK